MLCKIKDMAHPGKTLLGLLVINEHNIWSDQQQQISLGRRDKTIGRMQIHINKVKKEYKLLKNIPVLKKSCSHTGHKRLTLSKFLSALILV